MAYFRTLPSGKHRAEIEIDGVRDSATHASKNWLKNWAREREAEIRAGSPKGDASTVTVERMLKVYLDMVASKTDTAKWNTLRINKWLEDPLAKMLLPDVTTHDINLWIERRGKETYRGEPITPATVNRELTLWSGAFNYAVKSKKWIKVNPCHGVNRPEKGKSRGRRALTADEIRALRIATGYDADPKLRTLTSRVGACFLLALETGARSGEILRVKPEHYWRDKRTLFIAAEEKGGRKSSKSGRVTVEASRKVPLSGRAIELLDQLLATMPKDQPYIVGLDDSQRDALWRKARDQSGVEDLTFHDLKHEACTRLSKFLDVLALSHAIGTKDVKLLRDTYYINDASAAAALLPRTLTHEYSPPL